MNQDATPPTAPMPDLSSAFNIVVATLGAGTPTPAGGTDADAKSATSTFDEALELARAYELARRAEMEEAEHAEQPLALYSFLSEGPPELVGGDGFEIESAEMQASDSLTLRYPSPEIDDPCAVGMDLDLDLEELGYQSSVIDDACGAGNIMDLDAVTYPSPTADEDPYAMDMNLDVDGVVSAQTVPLSSEQGGMEVFDHEGPQMDSISDQGIVENFVDFGCEVNYSPTQSLGEEVRSPGPIPKPTFVGWSSPNGEETVELGPEELASSRTALVASDTPSESRPPSPAAVHILQTSVKALVPSPVSVNAPLAPIDARVSSSIAFDVSTAPLAVQAPAPTVPSTRKTNAPKRPESERPPLATKPRALNVPAATKAAVQQLSSEVARSRTRPPQTYRHNGGKAPRGGVPPELARDITQAYAMQLEEERVKVMKEQAVRDAEGTFVVAMGAATMRAGGGYGQLLGEGSQARGLAESACTFPGPGGNEFALRAATWGGSAGGADNRARASVGEPGDPERRNAKRAKLR